MWNSAQPRPSPGDDFDVVVVGGGINGVAIARDCAGAGARVLLLEQHDFCSGVTSRSTRIIHGGLRYLEHGEIGLVRESLREREALLCHQPHLVRPLRFVLALPHNGAHSALAVRAGLWFYRRLGGSPRHTDSAGSELHGFEKLLDSGRPWSLFDYEDAQCEFPERLVAEWLHEAVKAGATARNYTQLLEVERSHGDVTGIRARDLGSGNEFSVACKWVINATGPWASQVASSCGIVLDKPLIGGVRGSHIVLPRFPGAPDAALYSEAIDGRPFFIVPWTGQLLVGTTEVRDEGDPGKVRPAEEEIQYLLQSFNRIFPAVAADRSQIRYAFAGIRPLPYVNDLDPAAITRREILHDHAPEGARGMLSVIGGKLTTAASLARECSRRIGFPVVEPRATVVAGFPCNGIESSLCQWARQVAMVAGITAEAAHSIAEWHGRTALCVARRAERDPRMRAPLCPHTQHIVAEAVAAFEHEHAVTAADVLLRRVPVALAGDWDEDCSRTAVERIGCVMGWSPGRTAYELDSFQAERDAFLIRPNPNGDRNALPAGERAA